MMCPTTFALHTFSIFWYGLQPCHFIRLHTHACTNVLQEPVLHEHTSVTPCLAGVIASISTLKFSLAQSIRTTKEQAVSLAMVTLQGKLMDVY